MRVRARLATLLRGKLPDEDVAALRRLLDDPHLSAAKRSALDFGLAHVLDRGGPTPRLASTWNGPMRSASPNGGSGARSTIRLTMRGSSPR